MEVIVNGIVDSVSFKNTIGIKLEDCIDGNVTIGEERTFYEGPTILVRFESNNNIEFLRYHYDFPFEWWVPKKYCSLCVVEQDKLE